MGKNKKESVDNNLRKISPTNLFIETSERLL
jgi:hypothetical protein